PEEEKYLNSKAELHDMIVGLFGGRAAEELKFDSITTGASNDIERATDIARKMVTMYGMSDRFGVMGLSTVESQYLENRQVLNCSDVTAAAVDEEVRKILDECYKEAKQILSDNLDVMDQIAEVLIAKETITGKEFMKIYREAKGLPPVEDKTKEERELEEMHRQEEGSLERAREEASAQPEEEAAAYAANTETGFVPAEQEPVSANEEPTGSEGTHGRFSGAVLPSEQNTDEGE
ncbi:MAG: hypothetical protein J5935_04115, partial [Lachnospiraceae bacterium]|nr:hypothetical protein [Lachnospiraceae bacterium]